MKKRKNKEDGTEEKKSFWVTLPGIFTALATLITAIAGLMAALNTTFGIFTPKAAPSPIPVTFTVSPVVARIIETPTPIQPPVFTTQFILYSEDFPSSDVEQVEFDFEQGKLPAETIKDFIRLSRIAYGNFEPSGDGFDIQLILHNTGDRPLILDINERFFSLEDDRGQAAELAYFCCATKGGILPANQERTIQLFFRSPPGWSGKELSASYIFIRVNGLLPIIRVSWKMHTLAVAN
jgi:hypothetical protein